MSTYKKDMLDAYNQVLNENVDAVEPESLIKPADYKIVDRDIMSIYNSIINEKETETKECDLTDSDMAEIEEAKITDKKGLKEFAMTMASKAFGDSVDEKKVDKIVDAAIKDSNDDWGKAAGFVISSFK